MPQANFAFSQTQIAQAQYWWELVPYTWGPQQLPAGQTVVFQVQGWNRGLDSPDKIAILMAVAATQSPQVQVQWGADSDQSDPAQGWTDGFPANLRPLPVRAQALSLLSLTLNNTGAAIPNYQLNYWVAVAHLTATWKVMLQQPLSRAELQALQTLGLTQADLAAKVAAGLQPVDFLEREVPALFAGRRLSDPVLALPQHVTLAMGTSEVALSPLRPRSANSFLVVDALAFENAGQFSLQAVRDDQANPCLWVNASAYNQALDQAWPAWIPVTSYLLPQVISYGATGSQPLWLHVREYDLSDPLAARLGLSELPADTYARALLGLI